MNPHILIVDDEQGPREALEFVLRRENKWWKLSTASGLEEARDLIRSPPAELGTVDVVLTDLVMGDNEAAGMELLEFARRHDPFLMTILFTAKSRNLNRYEAFEVGAFDCIEKNILGRSASREIVVKTKAAVSFRKMALSHIENLKLKREAEEALKRSEERYALASRAANDGLWDWDLESGALYCSPRWKGQLGFGEEELEETPEEWLGRIHPDDAGDVRNQIRDHLLDRSERLDCEYRIRARDGSWRWMACRGLAVRLADGTPRRMVGSQSDVTPRKELEEQLRDQVFRDPLTGLANRALLLERLHHAIDRSQRADGPVFALLEISFDRFQRINESFGSDAGDRVLVEIARRFTERVRAGDTVARLGGAEFAVLIEECQNQAQAAGLTQRLQESLSLAMALDEHEIFLISRAGLCMGGAAEGPEAMIRAAQTAAAEARTSDRPMCVYQEAMRSDAPQPMELESELRRALQQYELVLHYQPILRLDTRRVVGFEALVRWDHPTRGLLLPGDFVPVSEDTGLIVDLGRWALQRACQQLANWSREFPASRALSVAVNVSGRQWLQPDLAAEVEAILHTTGLEPPRLKLEITESVLMDDRFSARETMRKVRDLGVEIHVDDFGTGYSAMSALHAFPISGLKVDRSFVEAMAGGGEAEKIVEAIIALAAKLDLATVAEGIETVEQLRALSELECQLGQGFLLAKPLAADEVETRLFGRSADPRNED